MRQYQLYKRKRQNRTDYRTRLELLKSRRPRLVVRRSQRHIRAQLVGYEKTGDKVLCASSSQELGKLGWKYSTNTLPAAYLTGMLCGKRSKEAKAQGAVLDIGLYHPHKGSKLYAALKGAVDSGFQVEHSETAFPSEERLNGTAISNYASELKKDKARYEKQFSGYLKAKAEPTDITKNFEEVKKKIMGGTSKKPEKKEAGKKK